MVPSLDIFRIESGDLRWCEAVANMETAKARIEKLALSSRGNYFGDIAGTGFAHVAFAWTFTTQPVQEDMLLLRNGLYGQGPFASFASNFPVSSLQAFPEVGTTVDPTDEPSGWQMSPDCVRALKTPYAVHWSDIKSAIDPAIPFLFPLSQEQLNALEAGLDEYVDYLVIGTYDSPYLMGEPSSPDPDLHFHVNFQSGQGDIRHTPIPWVAVIPKATPGHAQPFPVAYWRHGTTLFDLEIAVHAAISHWKRSESCWAQLAWVGSASPMHALRLNQVARPGFCVSMIGPRLAIGEVCAVPASATVAEYGDTRHSWKHAVFAGSSDHAEHDPPSAPIRHVCTKVAICARSVQ